MRRLLLLMMLAGAGTAQAANAPTYTLGSPLPPTICDTTDETSNAWLASNAVFVASSGFVAVPAESTNSPDTFSDVQHRLAMTEVGFTYERSKPEYYLSDVLEAPKDVDWNATEELFKAQQIAGTAGGFLFNPDDSAPAVYAISGGNQPFSWVLKNGTTNEMVYTVASTTSGRPRRIFWTDSPYNGPTISVQGKFIRFYGNEELLTLKKDVQVTVSGGQEVTNSNAVVSGLYEDKDAHVLYAAGKLTGQCVMVYYDTGNYDSILAVQVVEVCQPDVTLATGVIGEALKPTGLGYSITGLTPKISAGTGDTTDNRGDYLYLHEGQYSYSPKHQNVYPLRPTVGERWKAEVYWMETDAMGVQWPFELDQYENDWPAGEHNLFVRGDVGGDPGASIYIPQDYAAELQKYQDPEGHARAVTGANEFVTTGAGWSLLKLTADDNVWFLPIRSVLRSDSEFFTLKESRVLVGHEIALRSGTRSGLADGIVLLAESGLPGYIYKAASGNGGDIGYDVNLYHPVTNATSSTSVSTSAEETLPSAIYAISTNGPIEVWWSRSFQYEDMPYAIDIPTLPQVFRPVWPESDDMPQIVIASQQGSANEMIYNQGGAAYFDSDKSMIELAKRNYFPNGEGTVAFWTRPAVFTSSVASNAPSSLVSLGGSRLKISIGTNEQVEVSSCGTVLASAPMPPLVQANDWTHLAVSFSSNAVSLFVNGTNRVTQTADLSSLQGFLADNFIGVDGWREESEELTAPGRQVAELAIYQVALDAEVIDERSYDRLTGDEANLTGYYSFEMGYDLNSVYQYQDFDMRVAYERVHDEECLAVDVALTEPGPPARGKGIISSDKTPTVYYQNDKTKVGFNPNEEHAFVQAGSGGYVTWALRCDLNTDDTSKPAVFVEYEQNGRAKLQMYNVVLTNDTWKTLGADCVAGQTLPGPHPLDTFESPWLAEDWWDAGSGPAAGPAYRDRKGQIWARAAGTLPIYMYYRQQEGFWFPQLSSAAQPAVGASIPWLSQLDPGADQGNVLTNSPAAWTWNIKWPEDVPEMKIGQTLTVAENGLPEVWGAKSISVVYPDPDYAEDTVLLTDPTVMVATNFNYALLAKLGLTTDNNGGLTLKGGKYYFTDLPPHLSNRFYVDSTNNRMCFEGVRKSSAAGVSVLYPNVLSKTERALILDLVPASKRTGSEYETWKACVEGLANKPVKPNTVARVENEISTTYTPIDHYALSARGATNYVVLIENDATNAVMGVTEGDAINMHVLKVLPEYYTGRVVTREDEVNLLSQQLSVLYTDPFGGQADDFTFEWRSARPNTNGTVPDAYDNAQIYAPRASFADSNDPRIVIGGQGDTLDNMVNKYWVCRYRAASTDTPAYRTMGSAWSEWCAPPALAEGWVQRVLNNVTPFNQRMTDLYENAAETTASMIQQAGAPYQGDVALNQDNLNSVGLIQLYETLLNKAESMSLLLGIDDSDANKQLMLAAERLDDLYTLLGDEAYTDAKNPTIGFGSNMAQVDNQPAVDFGAASTSLFCFDNQVRSLLDEELALLRGRTGDSAPVTTLAPYYNRLVWNFTKGITAGEVAYAVNYNISGTQTTALSEEQAAAIYPQGHGDAYGHYLSALKGWYRLLRNPHFTWARAQGEMSLADATVNVDYYEEAKFAAAAAHLAKTAAEVVDLTARKSWRDNQGDLNADYLDANTNRAFGAGEWANRGAYGALVNWVAANSLLPEHVDGAELQRIDRETVEELDEICTHAANIMRASDRTDAMLNPLGLADTAIPFDITPIGANDGTSTHFEQIRARAQTALDNATKMLDAAQEHSNRLRMIQESSDNYEISVKEQEAAFTKELIGYYGMPYSDDIGPGKTYPQGYEGPDLVHYMWMDLSKFGLTEVKDTDTYSYRKFSDFKSKTIVSTVASALRDDTVSSISYAVSSSGLIQKDPSITGTRVTQGSIQEKYADFLLQYSAVKRAKAAYDGAVDTYENELDHTQALAGLYGIFFAADEVLNALKLAKAWTDYGLDTALNALDYGQVVERKVGEATTYVAPSVLGAGLTVVTSPRSVVEAIEKTTEAAATVAITTAKGTLKTAQNLSDTIMTTISTSVDIAKQVVSEYEKTYDLANELKAAASEVNSAANTLVEEVSKLNICIEAYNAEVSKGETCLAEREAARKKQVNAVAQYRYNDMFFRLVRNEELTRYATAFDLAQKYAFYSAQAYDYETAQLASEPTAGDAFKAQIIGARSLGELTDLMEQMDANWLVLKPRLGINNPQPYATWFSLRRECFRILPGEEGDAAWAKELTKHWVDDIQSDANFRRYCQPFQSQFGLKAQEPGLIIPFETTIDFAKNLFGRDLAGGGSAYDSTWYATRIAAAGLWFDDYNGKDEGSRATVQLAKTPVAYLVPIGTDCMRVPGLDENSVLGFSVTDQVIPAPYTVGSTQLDDDSWFPTASAGDWGGADAAAKIRRHPSFRAYYGEEPTDEALDATRLVGRSVWNTKWMLVIPAGGMNADREKALSIFINGSDTNRDGVRDLKPVSDIRLGFKTYSTSGN